MDIYCFDVETGRLPEPELTVMVQPFDPAEVKLGNFKDPEKIAAKLAEAEANHRIDFSERAALDPLTGRVRSYEKELEVPKAPNDDGREEGDE